MLVPCGDDALVRAIAELEMSRPVILPTDTVYGLAAKATDSDARATIFALKNRPPEKTMAVLVADQAQAAKLVRVDQAFERLVEQFWPGALTIVAPPADASQDNDFAELGAADGFIGVRAPSNEWVRALCTAVGPIVATSANIHGEPPATTPSALVDQFPNILVVDGGLGGSIASTVVRLDQGAFEVLRPGPVTADDISMTLG